MVLSEGLGRLCSAGDLVHGLMETEALDLDEEVNGVASAVSLGPAPIAVLDDEAGISGQDEIAGFLEDEVESLFCEQGRQRSQSGGADLLTRPAWLRGAGCHNLYASEVGPGRG